MARGQKQQDYEARQSNARNAVPAPLVPTNAELREYVGETAFASMALTGADDEPVDSEVLRQRYFTAGGLTLFLSEGFPNTTSLKPFGPGQQRAIAIVESVILNGGTEQSLEPRGFGKSSRVARAAIWALLGGYRRCGVIFQSNKDKAEETLAKIKNELAGSVFLRAIAPAICTACKHSALNPGIAKRQHYDDEPTGIQWLKDNIRLPNILGETGGGSRLLCMPFAKAAGISLSDPVTLEDIRPDLLLPDDVQSHDDCNSPRITEKLLRIWNGSVKYLCGRGKRAATVFTQTIFAVEDMADRLSKDPSVHTVKYKFLETFPSDMKWWTGEYKQTLLGYDQLDPEGQAKARAAANALYKRDRAKADTGAVVSWEHAYDPETTVSAIQQAMNNFLENEEAFWAQDQNSPEEAVTEDDIRARPDEILKKLHPEGRRVVPDWADRIVVHIDVHDSLLYYGVCAGSSSMQMALIDRQTWPKQNQSHYSLRQAHANFNTDPAYAELPTTADKIRAALNDCVSMLRETPYLKQDGSPLGIDSIAIDCSDGDHMSTVHAFCRENPSSNAIPMRGVAPTAAETPLNSRPKHKTERRRGDHWLEKWSSTTTTKWLEVDVAYYKTKLHRGLKAPIGTSESVSLWSSSSERTHDLTADHCNSETATWTTSKKANDTTSGVWKWTLKPNHDNHIFDNLVGCLLLLCYCGGSFAGVLSKQQRRTVSYAAMQHQKREKAAR